ncbi:hypothetical protein GCM10009696_33980 [Kocuria himachalensis]
MTHPSAAHPLQGRTPLQNGAVLGDVQADLRDAAAVEDLVDGACDRTGRTGPVHETRAGRVVWMTSGQVLTTDGGRGLT